MANLCARINVPKTATLQSTSSSSLSSSSESKKKGSDSTSGLLNILSTMKKAAMQKASAESRKRYSQAVMNGGRGRQARSEVDLSQIPGSCSYLRRQFDAEEQVRGCLSGFAPEAQLNIRTHYNQLNFWR